MDRIQAKRALEMVETLRDDCALDCEARDGQAFTGANVAKALGEIEAKIAALANVIIKLLEDGYEL